MDKRTLTDIFPKLSGLGDSNPLRLYYPFFSVRTLRYSKDRKHIFASVSLSRIISEKVLAQIANQINELYFPSGAARLQFLPEYDLPVNYSLSSILDEYRESLIEELSGSRPASRRILNHAVWTAVSETELSISLDRSVIVTERKEQWEKTLREIFLQRFFREVRVHFDENLPKKKIRITEAELAHDAPAASTNPEPVKQNEEPETVVTKPDRLRKGNGKRGSVKSGTSSVTDDPNLIYGRPIREDACPISDILPGEETGVVIRGKVFMPEIKPLRNNEKSILIFAVTDYTDSILCKLFLSNDDVDSIGAEIQNGAFIKLKGRTEFDIFEKELTIRSIYGIERIPEFSENKREDRAPVKRVELHCHTNMSENDAIPTAKEIIETADRFGHHAVALTDHGCVYAFPDAYHAVQKLNEKKAKASGENAFQPFKVIYGMEGYLVDDTRDFIVNPGNRLLNDTAVVFDLETTGLSPVEDRIIEIGAVKIENGVIVDRFSTFVNPKSPIPLRIELLTGIHNEHVKDAPAIEEAFSSFLQFADGAVLVAHNAEFDVGFFKETHKRLKGENPPDLTYIDTLGLSRVILSSLSNFKLDTVAKELGIPLTHHHRAVDDAECTAGIYLSFLNRFEKKGLSSLSEVQNAFQITDDAVKKLHSNHVVLLVRNETGRVNLYRICSASSLTYFHKRPLIPKSLLEKYREGLIVGSACSEGELYHAVMEGASDEEIARLVDFYDYLEIQPVHNNDYILRDDRNDIDNEEKLREINRKIVSLGDLFHKPVCATTDAHFLNPEDAVYREILQYGKGFDDADKQPPLYFRTTEEMLSEFEYLGSDKAYEVVVENTNRIADKIETISPVRPDKCPPVIDNADENLRSACYRKAHEIYGDPLPQIVEERLEKELSSIIGNGYAVMYMIAEKLVSKSISDGYLVGSRGSVGSSFAATMSGITEVNPLKPHYVCPDCKYSDFDSEDVRAFENYAGCDMPDKNCPVCGKLMRKDGFNIPFETFLGFKGNKEPDIDLNFSGEYQAKAHAYTEVIFGKGQTFRAGTYGGIAEKTAYGYAKHYYDEHGIPKRSCEIERQSRKLVGIRRTTGQHPGGIVVLPFGEEINTFTPIQHPANDTETPIITTSFEYHAIDHNLLKLDILGHDDPTMIRMLQELTGEDPTKFPLDSKEVMSLFESTEALGVASEDIRGCKLGALGIPEFGTDFAMNMVIACKPKHLSDLVRIAGMAHGTDVWSNNNQILFNNGTVTLDTAICCRDDIMEYLIGMGLESALAFTIMEAVRKGKGLTAEWEEEMRRHNVPEWYIWSCNKIKYMFPKAHAAAYVMMAWRIAYCKVFYPLEYYCSYYTVRADGFNYEKMCLGRERLISYMEEFEKSANPTDKDELEYRDMRIVQEMYARGFDFVPIDIHSVRSTEFQITEDRRIMPSLTSIANLGASAADSIVEAVHDGKGPFTSQSNFRLRAKVSQTIVDKLVQLGILSGLPSEDQFSLFDGLNV